MIATMTIIIAQKTTTGVLLAADNHSSDGQRRTLKATPKLVQVSPRIAYGTSGHTRLANVLRDNLDKFPLIFDPDYDEYEIRLARFFREILKDEYPESKMWALVAVDDVIFDIGPDGGLIRVTDPFTATGEAELVALGALVAQRIISKTAGVPNIPDSKPAHVIVGIALEACAAFIDSIRPPWTFVETKKPA